MTQQNGNIFDQIITLRDAQRRYKKQRSTLLYHINRGNVRAEKLGRYWLLVVADLDAMYSKSPSR